MPAVLFTVAVVLVAAGVVGFLFRPGGPGDGMIDGLLGGPPKVEQSTWAFEMVQATALSGRGATGEGVIVCIVDTGIDRSHPDLAKADLVGWRDFVQGRPDPYDDDGHGTGMAGLIVADGGVRGAAPGASILVAKAISSSGTGSDNAVASAIRWCVDPDGDGDRSDGAAIISLSLGGGQHPLFGSEVGDAAAAVAEDGIFVVASAGNDGEHDNGDVESPASEELVIAVGAVNRDRQVAPFSSKGDNDGRLPFPFDDRKDPNKKPETVAPGVDIVTTWVDDPATPGKEAYAKVSGTSPAAALAAGALALVLELHPSSMKGGSSSTVTQLKDAMRQSCATVPGQSTPHDDRYGYGVLQADALAAKLR